MPLRHALMFVLLATSATAQVARNLDPGAKGSTAGVSQFAFAQTLYAHALAQKNPQAMITAAQLATAVDLLPADRAPETSGDAAADQPDSASGPVDPARMLATARMLVAEDDTLIALLDQSESGNALVRSGNVRASLQPLAAGLTDTWTLPFEGGTLAEVAVIGDGDSNLDISVTDAGSLMICADAAPTDRAICTFVPAQTGHFAVTVQNHGPGLNSYLLLTN